MNALTPISVAYTRLCNATIIDRPCGSGKSTGIIRSFRTDQRYLVVVPTLAEIDNRYLPETDQLYGEGFFSAPSIDEKSTKYEHIEELLFEGLNIITTHALYMDIIALARQGLLKDYHIIIDEVLQVVSQYTGPKPKTWKKIYLGRYSYSSAEARKITTALSSLRRRQLADVPLENILITCKKRMWYQHGKGPKEVSNPRSGLCLTGRISSKGRTGLPTPRGAPMTTSTVPT